MNFLPIFKVQNQCRYVVCSDLTAMKTKAYSSGNNQQQQRRSSNINILSRKCCGKLIFKQKLFQFSATLSIKISKRSVDVVKVSKILQINI